MYLLHEVSKDALIVLEVPLTGEKKILQVSCVGGFGSNSFMYKINGTANINAITAAAEKGTMLINIHVIVLQYPVSSLLL